MFPVECKKQTSLLSTGRVGEGRVYFSIRLTMSSMISASDYGDAGGPPYKWVEAGTQDL